MKTKEEILQPVFGNVHPYDYYALLEAMEEYAKAYHKEKVGITPTLLLSDCAHKLGAFQLIHYGSNGELKIIVHNASLRLMIKPNTDNSCTLVAKR